VMEVNRVYLGLSLTTALLRGNMIEDNLVFDIWHGGSTLYGWDLWGQCVDRLPISVNDPSIVSALGGTPVEVSIEGELLGTEGDYESKVSLNGKVRIQRDWVAELVRKRWYASGGWCSVFRGLIRQRRTNTRALFGDLRLIDTERRLMYVLPHGLIEYGKIVSSLPLEYIVRKAALINTNHALKMKYVTIYVTTVITRGRCKPSLWFLGKRRFASSAIVSFPLKLLYPQLSLSKDDLILTYAFVPQLMGELNPDVRQKVLADIKRLGLDVKNALFIRSHFERYGYLGQRDDVNDVISTLAENGIECVGRLGTWKELSIGEILAEYSPIKQ